MENVTVSSKGQVAIPKDIRDLLNLAAGTKLTIEVRGQEVVLSKQSSWKSLGGSIQDLGFTEWYAKFKEEERRLEEKNC